MSMSRPSRARGLKQTLSGEIGDKATSRPSRARGLKPTAISSGSTKHFVAPFTGAWIETTENLHLHRRLPRRALHGRVD